MNKKDKKIAQAAIDAYYDMSKEERYQWFVDKVNVHYLEDEEMQARFVDEDDEFCDTTDIVLYVEYETCLPIDDIEDCI